MAERETAFGAVGGIADDTAAIQNALTGWRTIPASNRPSICLQAHTASPDASHDHEGGQQLIGHGRDTIISWDGPEGGTMLSVTVMPSGISRGSLGAATEGRNGF